MKTCQSCGNQNRDTAKFCQNCASVLSSEIACPSCGTKNLNDAKYCQNCATALRGDTPIHGLTGKLPADTILADRYTVERKLGQGGMGAVYLVSDTRLGGKYWAVKEMSDAALVDPQEKQHAIEAFQLEATLLASMSHPNLAKVMDYFEEGGKHYLVMDYIDGQTMDDLLSEQSQPFTEEQVGGWAVQLCDVLDYLHSQSQPVIFRDLKPNNVMLDTSGQIKLIDFGIARLFKPGKRRDTASFGTAGYSPPEQYGRGQTDARSDIYSLGATLHQLLTLRDPSDEPFRFPQVNELNSAVSDRMSLAIGKALDQDPKNRWQSVNEFSEAMSVPKPEPVSAVSVQPAFVSPLATQPVAEQETIIKKVEKSETLKRNYIKSHPLIFIVGGILLVGLVLAAVLIFTDVISFGESSSRAVLPGSTYSYMFTSNRDHRREIYRLEEDGSTVRVTNTPAGRESWSPIRTQAGRIVFVSDRDGKRELFRLDDSGEVVRVTHSPGRAESWSPSVSASGRILFVSNRDEKREIYRIGKNGETVRVTNSPGDAESWSPSLSPKGNILFVSNRDGKREIYRIDESGSTFRVTNTPGEAESWSPSISPKGKILFVSNRDGRREVYRMDETGEIVRVTNTPRGAESWGPDLTPAGRILYTSNRDGETEIYRLDETGDVVRVTNTPGHAGSWTPTSDREE